MMSEMIPARPRWQVGDVFFDGLARHQRVIELRYENRWVYVTESPLIQIAFRFTDQDFMSEFDFTPPALMSSSG